MDADQKVPVGIWTSMQLGGQDRLTLRDHLFHCDLSHSKINKAVLKSTDRVPKRLLPAP